MRLRISDFHERCCAKVMNENCCASSIQVFPTPLHAAEHSCLIAGDLLYFVHSFALYHLHTAYFDQGSARGVCLDAGVGLDRNLLPHANGTAGRVGSALHQLLAVVQTVTRRAPPLLLCSHDVAQYRAPFLGAPF
jgi:hypothetical protein